MTSNTWLNEWIKFLEQHPLLHFKQAHIELNIPEGSAHDIAGNEVFWKTIQALFPHPEGHVNLNNGGVCSNALHIEQAFTHFYSLLNTSPSYFTWKVMEAARDIVKEGLASMINATKDEIAIFRNASEALNNAIFGIQLTEGDEVVACRQDYTKCISSWKQRELRENINIQWVELTGQETNEEVVAKYIAAFTAKTKVLHLTHLINWNGQRIPAETISNEAKKRGIIVVLDAAHSFAMHETDMQKIDCDYMGTALHKWLSGPIAAGMLYVKKERIADTYPLASAIEPLSDNIKKFEEMSIQVLPNLVALGYAIQFHLTLSRELKEARLLHLRSRWTDALQQDKRIHFNVPLNSIQCGAIANFYIKDRDPLLIEKELFDQSKIHVVGFQWPNLSGIRITPNIYTRMDEIDAFIEGVRNLS